MWKVTDKEKIGGTTNDGCKYLCTYGNPDGLVEVYKGYGGIKLFGKVIEGNLTDFYEELKANTDETIVNDNIDPIEQDDESGINSLRQRINEVYSKNQDSYEKISGGPIP